MTSAARGRAVGVVAALVMCAATLAGSGTVPVRTGDTGADPRQPHAYAHAHVHVHGHHDHATTSLASAPTGLEALAAHAQHEDEEQAAGPSRADDTRAL